MENIIVQRKLEPAFESLHRILNLTAKIKIVDIGANPIDGEVSYAPLLANGHAQIVGFEPNLDALERLNQRKGPNETYLPYAIADGARHTLHHCLLPGMTSLLEPNPGVLSLFYGFADWGKVVRTEEVDTARLDDIPETAGLDMLKIDIQGGELMVFKNAPTRMSEALLIQTEVEFMPMYIGQPLFSDVDIFLREHGFMLHRLEPLVTRDFKPLLFGTDPYEGHSQVLWADAIYVRDLTQLGKLDAEQLLKLAVILHDCYKAYDCALYLLREYDRRTNQNYRNIYFAAVTSQNQARLNE